MYFNFSHYFFALLVFVLVGCRNSSQKNQKNLIKDYVSITDPSYRYDMVDTVVGDGWKEYKVRMVSGSWLDKTNFDDSSNDWWHWVSIIVPDDLDNSNSMMDILLSKKNAPARKEWLEKKGSLAKI